MKRACLTLLAAVLVAACASVEQRVARGVNGYCATVSPVERSLIRERVNLAIAPHRIEVQCAEAE